MKVKLSKSQVTLFVILVLLFVGITGVTAYFAGVKTGSNDIQKNITSFSECAKAGYPIMQTYPEQCKTPDGRTFTDAQTAFPTQTPPSLSVDQNSCNTDNDCTLKDTSMMNSVTVCCQLNRCADYSKDTVHAVNVAWFTTQKTSVCSNKQIECPMIAMMCTRQITESQRNYQAKCVNNICEKVYRGGQ